MAPGLVHQFGNLLLTIQGHSQYLEAEAAVVARAKPAILTACERGAGSLCMLRHLLGGAGHERAQAVDVVAQLVELLRVPVREAGHVLQCTVGDEPAPVVVALDSFVPLAVALVRCLVSVVPDGVRGTVVLALQVGPPAEFFADFQAAAGSLPFPLATASAIAQLRAEVVLRGWPHRIEARPAGIAVQLPRTAGVSQA